MKLDAMEGIAKRLAAIRDDAGLSLRDFAETIHDRTGLSFAHDSVRHYENGNRRVPSDYVGAVCRAFDVKPQWLLFGSGPPSITEPSQVDLALEEIGRIVDRTRGRTIRVDVSVSREDVLERWALYLDRHRWGGALEHLSVRDLDTPGEDETDGGAGRHAFAPVSVDDLESRLDRHGSVLEAAEPDMVWLSSLYESELSTVSLIDEEGVLLRSVGSAPNVIERWSLQPGLDLSRSGPADCLVGGALQLGKPVVAFGTDDLSHRFGGLVSLSAPVRRHGREDPCFLSLTTKLRSAEPARMISVLYAVGRIEAVLADAEAIENASGGKSAA